MKFYFKAVQADFQVYEEMEKLFFERSKEPMEDSRELDEEAEHNAVAADVFTEFEPQELAPINDVEAPTKEKMDEEEATALTALDRVSVIIYYSYKFYIKTLYFY